MPATARPSDPSETSRHAIKDLIIRYAALVDAGDFAGLGHLLADATFTGSGKPLHGREEIERMFRDTVILYPDGTPRTQHVVTNTAVETDEQAGTATALSYVAVLQSLPGLDLQFIAVGRYDDRFERHDGQWRFTERQVRITLIGDVSGHLRTP
ncbi:hypothetical protein ATKI12_7955 [Kitasatospora sp. Ki12]|uniref:nuclear transport factor 2 family protein n=1 Tax=Kitasatospora xanthocidica TaxID=83382 RepID=UPI00167B7278|nr:nuclear transport factor 2 family protein [Kitasatospora xanthocidica]GHF35366.1 hypothetical protein GCM10018790_11430 [Kitasatospora xanthocidica]